MVTDASVVLAFIMDDERVPYADAAVVSMSREGAAVPGNFQSELVHALLQAERRGRIDHVRAMSALVEILALPLTIQRPSPVQAMQLGRQHRLTGYDSFYLALAMELGQPLATVDAALTEAARALNVHWTHAT